MGLPERGQAAGSNLVAVLVLVAPRDRVRAPEIIDAVSVSVCTSKFVGDNFVAAGRFSRLQTSSGLSDPTCAFPELVAGAVGGTPVPSQRPSGCPRSSASSAPFRSSRFAPCRHFRARRPAAVSQVELQLHPGVRLMAYWLPPTSDSTSSAPYIFQHLNQQPVFRQVSTTHSFTSFGRSPPLLQEQQHSSMTMQACHQSSRSSKSGGHLHYMAALAQHLLLPG